jgi:hypothetical protein
MNIIKNSVLESQNRIIMDRFSFCNHVQKERIKDIYIVI